MQLSNELMSDISKVVTCVLKQANKLPELAQRLEERDIQYVIRWNRKSEKQLSSDYLGNYFLDILVVRY
ncbi:hypothetical protein [Lactococcus lactis]|uniref:hypothetical protein n=1 Tax=Lactococcus lactis TaxID=1358 RepID=UPI001D1917BB|nr:hypothetical protein [Lactococcus lactis]MCC4121702.1 hypothetical protein [Lactococcus lactis]